MVIPAPKPLFAWDELEDCPSLRIIKELLNALPDATLLNSLRNAPGQGRNDYPIHVLWGVVVLRLVLRQITTEAVLADLRRDAGLRALIGIDSEAGVPRSLPPARRRTMAYDKAADSEEVHRELNQAEITPVIPIRGLWKTEPEPTLPGHDGTSNVVHDELGTIYCYD